MADNSSKRGEQTQSRKGRTSAILAQLSERELKLIKVEINRYHIPKNPNPPPLVTAIENVAELILHRRGEGQRPIFDRDDIVVNQEEPEERIISHDRRRRSRSRTRKSQDRSSSESSSSRARSSRSRSSSSTTKKKKNRYKSRSVEKTSDSGKAKNDRCPHSRIDFSSRGSSTFKLEGIFKNVSGRSDRKLSPSRSRKDQNRSGSREEPSKRLETERDRYYREKERDARGRNDVENRERRRTPSSKYSRSRSPYSNKKRSSQSRSPYHSRRRNSRSPSLHSKRYSRSPRRSRSKERHPRSPSAPRKKYSKSPERLKDDRNYRRSPYKGRSPPRRSPYRRSPYRGPPERRSPYRRPRERSPYRSRTPPRKDIEKGYKPRKEGYTGPQGNKSPPGSDKKELSKRNDPPAEEVEEYNMTQEYGYIEGQPVWYPGPIPFPPLGIRQPLPYPPRFRFPWIRHGMAYPFSPAQGYFKPRLPVYNRPFRQKVPTTSTITSSAGTSNETSTSQEKASESQTSGAPAVSVSDSNANLGSTVTTSGLSDNNVTRENSSGNGVTNAADVSGDRSKVTTPPYLVDEPEDTNDS